MANQEQSADQNFDALLFEVSSHRYAVNANRVRKILWLPEISFIDDTPPYHCGLFILRGEKVNIINLSVRLGHESEKVKITDCIIVLETSKGLIGLIANYAADVVQLQLLSETAALPPSGLPSSDAHRVKETSTETSIQKLNNDNAEHSQKQLPKQLIVAQALYQNEIVMIVNEEQLLRYEDSVMTSNPNCFAVDELQEHEKEILRQRMLSYRDQVDDLKQTEQLGLVVVSVAGETYGLVLSDIKELMNQSDLVSIPCCPPHILGNMNLRGDIVTLIDISGILKLSGLKKPGSQELSIEPDNIAEML